jgi:hypothetical protein
MLLGSSILYESNTELKAGGIVDMGGIDNKGDSEIYDTAIYIAIYIARHLEFFSQFCGL